MGNAWLVDRQLVGPNDHERAAAMWAGGDASRPFLLPAYGAALNEGRGLFPGDREFGEWLRSSNLEEGVHPADQSAAMWADL